MGDGSINAPAGSPQLPTLLDSYGTNRPSWEVAGVDYAVGYPAGTVFKNPATISMAGVSVNTSTHTITVTGNNVTLDGYDFSLNGGWGVVVQGANTRIVDSNFVVGSNGNQPIFATASSSNLYVGYCVVDGNNVNLTNLPWGGLVEMRGTGTFVVEYSSVKNSGGDLIQFNKTNSAPGDMTIQYNLLQNAGLDPGAHGDYTQELGGPFTVHINYNTTLQTAGGTQGLMVEPDYGMNGGGILTGGEVGNNTMISKGSGFVTYLTAVTGPDVINTFTVHDNYFDTNGYGFSPGGVRGAPNDSYAKTIYTHNVNMKTGAVLQDSNAPTVPTIASFSADTGTVGDHITNDNTLTLTGTAAANSTVNVFDGTTQIGTATTNASGAWSYTTAGLADGAHNLTAKNNAGSTSTALSVTIDTTAPGAPNIVSNTINSNAVTLNGTAEANSKVQIFDGSTQLGTATTNSSGVWTYTTAALTNGVHSLTAIATDVAGNASVTSGALSVTIDTTTPAIASFSADTGTVGDHITNDNTLTLTGTAAANSTVNVFDGTTQIGTATTNASGAWSYTAAGLADGAHNLTAKNNAGSTSTALSVTIDTTAPGAPNIVSNTINSNAVTLNGTAEANSKVQIFDGSTQLGTATTNSSGVWTYTTAALTNGAHSLTAIATDVAGNASVASGALSVMLNAPVNPVNPVNLVANGGFETGDFTGWTLGGVTSNEFIRTVTHSGQYAAQLGPVGADGTLNQTLQTTAGQQYTLDFWLLNAGAGPNDFTVKWNGTSLLALVNASAQNYTEYTYTVTATGGTSNLEFDFRQDPAVWRLDDVSVMAVGPAAPTIATFSPDTGVVGDGITDPAILTLTGTAVANSAVNVYDGTTLLGTTTANGSGAWNFVTAALPDGKHNFTATDTVSGTTSAASAVLSVTIDTTAPVAPSITSFTTDSGTVGDHITNDNTLTLTGTAEANSTVKIYDGATLLSSVVANSSGAWTYTTAALANGAHNLTATATDVAGNTSAASVALSVTIDTTAPTAPTIASFSTDTGTIGDHITNDNTLTLIGTAEANSRVNVFDGPTLLGSATTNGSGAWSYTTPVLANSAHNLTATVIDAAGNTGPASTALAITVAAPPGVPTITSFSPDTGIVGDGITEPAILTLTGSAVANSIVNVYDGTTLLGTSTANASGIWNFTTVSLPDGMHSFTSTDTLAGVTSAASAPMNVTIDTVAPIAPTIASFSTDTGTVGDHITTDNTLTLTGTTEANSTVKVYDGANMLGSVTANSSGAWTYTTAALANGAHNLTATATDAAGNTGPATAALTVTIIAPPGAPVITSFSPDTGIVGDGITDPAILTLTGNAVANSTVNVYDGTTLLGTSTANASGVWSFTTVPLLDGMHRFTTTDTLAGVTSAASAAMNVTVDTVAPAAPTIASFSNDSGTVGDHITNDNTLTLTGTAEANSTVNVFDGTKLLGSAVANGGGGWSYTTTALANGAHSLTATAIDAAANTSMATSALAVTVDTTAPVAPTIASFSNDTGTMGDHITNDNTLTLAGTAEANSTVKVYDGSTLLGNAVANGSGGWSYTTGTLAIGAHSFTATDGDAAGNISAASTALDVSVEKLQTPISIDVQGYTSPVPGFGFLTGTSEANSLVSIYDGHSGAGLGMTVASSAGSWSLPVIGQPNSVRDFIVKATDQAGNTGSAHVIYGTTGNDTITNSAPNEFLYGNGGNDTFVFSGNIGKDTIADFSPSNDIVQLGKNTFADFAAVLAHATQVGSDVTITIDPSNSVTLHNTALSQLTHNNIHIV